MLTLLIISSVLSKNMNPLEGPFPVIQNQGWTSILNKSWARIPPSAQSRLRPSLYSASQTTPGFALHFRTNSGTINIKSPMQWNSTKTFDSISPIPETGILHGDIYFKHPDDGHWVNAVSGVIQRFSGQMLEYKVYLPHFIQINNFYIQIDDNAQLEWIEKDYTTPIVVYGGSTVQGVVTTRPTSGPWPTILHMNLDTPVLNFGFINNGKMDKAMIDIIAEGNNATIFIIDGLPDVAGFEPQTIKALINRTANIIRKYHPTTPILFLDHIGFGDMDMVHVLKRTCERVNQAHKEIIDEIRQRDRNVHRLPREDMGMYIDAWADSAHPNSLGHRILAMKIREKIQEILNP